MTSSRDRSIFGFLSLILFIVNTYILLRISPGMAKALPLQSNFFITSLAAFNVVILLGWMGFGPMGGLAMTIASITMGAWAILRAELPEYSALIVTYLVASFIGYILTGARERFVQEYDLKLEKLDEEINIVLNNEEEKRKVILSLEDKLKRYSILKDVVEELSTALSTEEISRLIVEKTINALGKAGRTLLFAVDTERQELMLSFSKNAEKVKAKKGDAFDHWVLRNRRSMIIEDIEKDFRFHASDIQEARESFRSLIAMPLISENKVIGILRMDSMREFTFIHDDLRLLDIIADLGAVAMQNALLYTRTQELAIKDGLTGLFVRRYFMERFREEIKRAARKKGNFSVLMFDIDHFKKYNDEYGHTAGDLVLKHLSRMISSIVREVDMVARYGGEEFVALVIGMDSSAAAKEAEAIRKEIEKRPLTLRRKEMRLTVSVGVASYPEDAVMEEELLKIADERLYKAKAGGRNRVCAS